MRAETMGERRVPDAKRPWLTEVSQGRKLLRRLRRRRRDSNPAGCAPDVYATTTYVVIICKHSAAGAVCHGVCHSGRGNALMPITPEATVSARRARGLTLKQAATGL